MPKAFFQTIYQDIKQSIESGLFSYQSLLMSENDLCHQYGCSRSTVRRALSELTAGGYVQPIQGKGVRVIWRPETDDDNMAFSMGGLESFHMCAERMGFKQSTEVRAFEHRIVDEACSRTTGFSVGTPIYYIDRVRSADDVPVSHEFSYLLESEAPGLTAQDAAGSLYSYIENLGTCIGIGKRTITVEAATEEDFETLKLTTLPAVGVLRGQHFDSNGIMFEYSEVRHHPYFFAVREVATRPDRDNGNRHGGVSPKRATR